MLFAWVVFFAISQIDQEIDQLSHEIQGLRLKVMQKEVDSERDIHGDWKVYTQDIQAAEVYENEIEKKETRLHQLLHEKERAKE